MSARIRCALIGFGYWGPNLLRNLSDLTDAEVRVVCDPRPDLAARIGHRYPGVETAADFGAVLARTDIDAFVIATPPQFHASMGLAALDSGRHVWVEKPLATTMRDAERLVDRAKARGLTLMVDHTFVYTGAVRKMRDLVAAGELGRVLYYDSVRVNLGLVQSDVSVLWDLAVHDLSIMDYVIGAKPVAVSALGVAHVVRQPVSIAYLTTFCEGGFIGHCHVNWLAPVKIRRTLVGGDRRMIVYDELDPDFKVKLFDSGVDLNPRDLKVNYRTGDVHIPQLDRTEALALATRHFVECIRSGAQPITGPEAGLRVVQILEAAERSMARQGEAVSLEPVS
ncbi:MAG TPA: Gfo/Idh/MocA family oxidoreductase [Candidatus Sulfotelmatobacter sp.]|nr:Gfo/Idh/MocA family oxidoreductase [Candidatus Sulfotelmatobacter sp.]